MLRGAFFCFAALWLVGGFATRDYALNNRLNYLRQLQNPDPFMINVHDFFVNICGSITVILGLILLIRWIVAKSRSGATQASVMGGAAPLASSASPIPPAQPATPPPPTPAPPPPPLKAVEGAGDSGLSASWVGWLRRKNELVIEYTFKGSQLAGGQTKVQINVSVEKGSFQTFKMVNMFVVPRLIPEAGYLAILLTSATSEESTGFIPVRTTPTPGDATLMNIEGREDADKVFQFLSLGKVMELQIWAMNKPLVKLLLHNDAGFINLYREIEAGLR